MNNPKNEKSIHEGHRQRVKSRFINQGLSDFEEHQALELLLFYALPQKDTNDLAHSLINEFGSLAGVLDASVESLKNVKGVGENTAVLIKLIPEFYAMYLKSKSIKENKIIDNPEAACNYFIPLFLNKSEEVLMAAFLDNKMCIKKTALISEGGYSGTEVSLRKIVDYALTFKTPNIIIAHNHPSGIAVPSAQDIDSVRQMNLTLKKLELNLADSVIVAGINSFSMSGSKKFSYLFR